MVEGLGRLQTKKIKHSMKKVKKVMIAKPEYNRSYPKTTNVSLLDISIDKTAELVCPNKEKDLCGCGTSDPRKSSGESGSSTILQ